MSRLPALTSQRLTPGRRMKALFVRHRVVIIPVLSLGLFTLLWYAVTRYQLVSPLMVPSPYRVWRAFVRLVQTGELWIHLGVSGVVFITGFSSAAVLGSAIGYILGMHRTLETIVSPYLIALYSAPRVAFIMVILAWFGTDLFAKSLLVFMGAFFPITLNVLTGVKQVNREFINAARVFGATPMQRLFKVTVPFTVPYLFAGLQLGVGRALIGVFVAEMFGANDGIGAFIIRAGFEMNSPNLYAGIIILALLSIAFTEGIRYLGRRLTPWQPNIDA